MITMESEKSVLLVSDTISPRNPQQHNLLCEFVESCLSNRRELRAYFQGDFSASVIFSDDIFIGGF